MRSRSRGPGRRLSSAGQQGVLLDVGQGIGQQGRTELSLLVIGSRGVQHYVVLNCRCRALWAQAAIHVGWSLEMYATK